MLLSNVYYNDWVIKVDINWDGVISDCEVVSLVFMGFFLIFEIDIYVLWNGFIYVYFGDVEELSY